MQVLSSSQKRHNSFLSFLPESMFDFIYAKDGEAVIKKRGYGFYFVGRSNAYSFLCRR